MKIAVVGYSGSGKSTLAKYLGKIYNIPVMHLDTIQFCANWQIREEEESKKLLKIFMENDSWIIDGNYSNFYYDERLKQADKIIFLNFNRFVRLYRVILRYNIYKGKTRPDMAEGCNEKLDREFIWWVFWESVAYRRKRRFNEIKRIYSEKVIELKNQKQLNTYMRNSGGDISE